MKQIGLIEKITKLEDLKFSIKLRNVVGEYIILKHPECIVGDKIELLYRIDKDLGFVIEQINKPELPIQDQRSKDISANVVLKLLVEMVCSDKIENIEEIMVFEGKKLLKVFDQLRE